MDTLYIGSSAPLDMRAVTLMGASVKMTSSAIGYFGTGLKFAIATLLRTGHKVRIVHWMVSEYHLDHEMISMRGAEFSVGNHERSRAGLHHGARPQLACVAGLSRACLECNGRGSLHHQRESDR